MHTLLKTGRSSRKCGVLVLAVAVLSILVGIARAEAATQIVTRPEQLATGPVARVIAVLDGDTVILDDRQHVRLTGLNAPEIAHPPAPAEPYGAEAKSELAQLLNNRQVHLYYGGARNDRYGRVLAHLVRDDGLWIQQEMVRRGAARVYTFADNRALAAPMLAAEQAARAARKGLWAKADYAVRNADQPIAPMEVFHVVEGRVTQVIFHRSWIFINFGADWRKDFTATISGKDRSLFDKNWLMELEGQMIRVHGRVHYHNGPSVTVTHPEQIEIVTNASDGH